MARYIHRLHEVEHEFFLKQGRKDIFTMEMFKAGDRVVICAKCKAAFLAEVWIDEFSGVCRNDGCHSIDTLPNLPKPQNIFFSPPRIYSFTVNKKDFFLGEVINLTWSVGNADVIKIGNKIVSENSDLEISLSESTHLRLWARNNKGITTKDLSVSLLPPEITFFSSDKKTIFENEPIILSWRIIGSKSFSLYNNHGEFFHPSSNLFEVKPRQNTIFYLKATNGELQTIRELNLEVKPLEILSFSSDRELVVQKEVIRLEWEVKGAVSVDINNGIGQVKNSGFLNYKVDIEDINFILSARSEYGTIKREFISIKVASIKSFGTNKLHENAYLFNWRAKHFTSLELYENNVDTPIYEKSNIENETEFEMELAKSNENRLLKIIGKTSNGLKVIENVILKVPKIKFVNSDSMIISRGKEFRLSWAIEDVNKILLNHGIGDVTNKKFITLYGNQMYKSITITAIGDLNEVTYDLELYYIEVANLENATIPSLDSFEISSFRKNYLEVFQDSIVENKLPRFSGSFLGFPRYSFLFDSNLEELPSPDYGLFKEKLSLQNIYEELNNSVKKLIGN